jgi:hypothetical protein
MTSYFLPKIILNINNNNIKLKVTNKNIEPHNNKSLSNYLKNIKNKINKYPSEWNYNKKYTNIYEFIHTNINQYNSCISQLKPISRAFYKLVEIINTFNVFNHFKNKNIKSFHIAEAPGGFMEATSYLRNNINDLYYGTTLIDPIKKNIPV